LYGNSRRRLFEDLSGGVLRDFLTGFLSIADVGLDHIVDIVQRFLIITRLTRIYHWFPHEFAVDKPQGPCYGVGHFRL
jgi:hypothetical protein